MECVFCRIVRREAPASLLHEDDQVLAFCDLNPVNPGHLLVVPKVHGVSLADLSEADGQRVFTVGQRLAAVVRTIGVRCEGVNLFLADGEAAGQEVFHVHLHVIPRFKGDRFRLVPGSRRASRRDLDDVASRVRAAL
jgi:diadenosine tetraphosphate (Ap4A) HIT family hydrolase